MKFLSIFILFFGYFMFTSNTEINDDISKIEANNLSDFLTEANDNFLNIEINEIFCRDNNFIWKIYINNNGNESIFKYINLTPSNQ